MLPLAFIGLAFSWASSYIVIKLGGTDLPLLPFVEWRLGLGLIALVGLGIVRRQRRPPRRVVPHLMTLGVLGVALPFSLITWGTRQVDAGSAALLIASTPLFAAGLAAALLVDERLSKRRVAGLALGLAGVAFVAGAGSGVDASPIGVAALLGAAASYAATGVYARRNLGGVPPLMIATGQTATAFVVTGAVGLAVDGAGASAWLPDDPATVAAAAWLGAISSGVGGLLYYRLIAAWGPNRTALVNYLTPVVAVAGAVLVLGESIEPRELAGGTLVLAGIALGGGASPRSYVRRLRSARISRAALRPGTPVTPPPGWAPDPAR